MKRKLIIDGNAVYEIDEECMLKRKMNQDKEQERPRGNTIKRPSSQVRP